MACSGAEFGRKGGEGAATYLAPLASNPHMRPLVGAFFSASGRIPRVLSAQAFSRRQTVARPFLPPPNLSQPSGAIRCVSISLSCHPTRARNPFSPRIPSRSLSIRPIHCAFLSGDDGFGKPSLPPPPLTSNHNSLPIDIHLSLTSALPKSLTAQNFIAFHHSLP